VLTGWLQRGGTNLWSKTADLLMKPLDQVQFETVRNDMCARLLMGVQLSTKFIKCLGGSVKVINTVWWTRLFVTAATVLVSMS
jgi:hypothetical protein